MTGNDFADLMERFRAGDPGAARQLVERFEPQIRRAIRVRSTGSRLQRVLDSADVCQSVLRRLWEHRNSPGLPTEDPGGLVKWLLTVARNRIREEARRQGAVKREGGRRREADQDVLDNLPGCDRGLLSDLVDRELLQRVLAHLPPMERAIAEARADGTGWDELGQQYGVGAEALRKQYRRSVAEVAEKMNKELADDRSACLD